MPIDIDLVAIIVTESFGTLSFLLAIHYPLFLFYGLVYTLVLYTSIYSGVAEASVKIFQFVE